MSPRDAPETAAVAPAPVRPKPSLFLLVAMTGLGPFTMQIVIPSMPLIAAALAVPYGTLQLTLTLYLIGVALGQLLYGPLSDRYGRKPLLLAGLGLYLLGSAAAAVTMPSTLSPPIAAVKRSIKRIEEQGKETLKMLRHT